MAKFSVICLVLVVLVPLVVLNCNAARTLIEDTNLVPTTAPTPEKGTIPTFVDKKNFFKYGGVGSYGGIGAASGITGPLGGVGGAAALGGGSWLGGFGGIGPIGGGPPGAGLGGLGPFGRGSNGGGVLGNGGAVPSSP